MIDFVSELDPSGLDLQRAWEQALRDFGVVYIMERIHIPKNKGADHVNG